MSRTAPTAKEEEAAIERLGKSGWVPVEGTYLPVARYREMELTDAPFIYNSWLRSYGKTLEMSPGARKHYVQAWREVVERLVKRGQVLVACDPRSPNCIWAYVCFEERKGACVVHWVYTRQLYRRFGFARRLVGMASSVPLLPLPMENSHRTEAWVPLGRRFRSRFNPSAAR